MTDRLRAILPLPFVLAFAAVIFFTGINWGLPSREADRYLYPTQPPPSGAEILDLTGGWAGSDAAGADVDRDPIAQRDQPSLLNATERDRAALLLRYRLYSAQPDEMITFRALAQMRPGEGDLDPRLYQYGGLWIYPVGALLKLASLPGWIHLTSDLAHYLDHPEDFACFYVVARAYSAAWGLLGVVIIYSLAMRLTAGRARARDEHSRPGTSPAPAGAAFRDRVLIATAAAMLFSLLPVVVNLAHEAKPHLAGAVLVLATVLMAARYVDRPVLRRAVLAGVTAGAAGGMVLTGLLALLALPIMAVCADVSGRARARDVLAAGGVALVVFSLCNPFLILRLARGDAVSQSNLTNVVQSLPETHQSDDGGAWRTASASIVNAAQLTAYAITWPIAIAGVGAGALVIGRSLAMRSRFRRRSDSASFPHAAQPATNDSPAVRDPSPRPTHWLLLAIAVATFIPFVFLAPGRPAEFARFAAVAHLALLLGAVALVATLRQRPIRALVWLALLGWIGIHGLSYVKAFSDDARGGSRRITADVLQTLNSIGCNELLLFAEPAPYNLPPVDLHNWRIVLLPPGSHIEQLAPSTIALQAVDLPSSRLTATTESYTLGGTRLPTPMTFANRPFQLTQIRLDRTTALPRSRARYTQIAPVASADYRKSP